MAAKAIAFINFKGGVGKTAATVNIASCLSYYQNKRVLIVDLDPQCNSSFWLMPPHQWHEHVKNGARSTYQIFQDHIVGSQSFDFESAIIPGVPRREMPLIPKLDLLPAAIELLTIEDRIYQNKYARFFEFLYKTLKPYYREYDYIFFDCPPNTYAVTKNALFASDYCIVPYIPDFLSLSGFQILAEQIELFNDRISGFKTSRRRASIGALLVSHYRKVGNVFDQAINELEIILSHLKSQNRAHAKAAILTPYIRYSTAIAESTNEHLPVILHNPNSIGAEDYHNVAQAFDAHFQELT